MGSIDLGIGLAVTRGLGVSGGAALAALRPLSYVKAIPNEYNSGTGLGATGKQVGGHCHFAIYDDVTDGSFEVRFWHGGASAGQGEWNTGGTMTVSCSLEWIDQSGNLQRTTLNDIKATANGFEETIHRHPSIRPKVGSHALLTFYAVFSASGYYSHARADYAQGEALRYSASGLPNYVGTGTRYVDSWNGGGDFWGPSFFGWSGGALAKPAFSISGDSNHAGVYGSVRSDIPDTLDGGIGSVARLLLPFMPGIDISIPGGTAAEMSDPAKTLYRDIIGGKSRASALITPLGTNDIIFNGASEAALAANLSTYLSRLGFAAAFLPTIPPVVTDQNTNTVQNPTRDVQRKNRNTSLRALSNVMDIAVGTESAGTPGTLQFLSDTVDGTHFNAAGNKRAAAGSGFNVASKIPGAALTDIGFQYAAGALYQSLGLSGWTGQQATPTLNAEYSPEHKITATILKEDASSNRHTAFSQQTLALASTTKRFTGFIKRKVGARNAQLQVQQNGGSFLSSRVWINLGTGATTIAEQAAGAVSNVAASLTDDGYWKLSFDVTFGAGHPASSYLYVVMTGPAFTDDNYAGDNTSSIAFWGFDIR